MELKMKYSSGTSDTLISKRTHHKGLGQFNEKEIQIPRMDVSYGNCHQIIGTGYYEVWTHFLPFILTHHMHLKSVLSKLKSLPR